MNHLVHPRAVIPSLMKSRVIVENHSGDKDGSVPESHRDAWIRFAQWTNHEVRRSRTVHCRLLVAGLSKPSGADLAVRQPCFDRLARKREGGFCNRIGHLPRNKAIAGDNSPWHEFSAGGGHSLYLAIPISGAGSVPLIISVDPRLIKRISVNFALQYPLPTRRHVDNSVSTIRCTLPVHSFLRQPSLRR